MFLVLAIFSGGCGTEDSVIYQISDSENVSASSEEVTVSSSEPDSDEEDDEQKAADNGAEADGTGTADSESVSGESTDILYVYVCGAVVNPGVYQLPAGSRIYQAVQAAGGMTEEADDKSLNQAEALTDGQQITVYTKEEVQESGLSGVQSGDSGTASGTDGSDTADKKVNLNTATKEELMTLPGIGESRADAIIEYRTTSGGFSSIEDIQNISGIKEKAFEKIKDYIEV